MSKNKIERIDLEIAKTREKIAEQQEKLKTLEAQKTEAENLEIVQMVRAARRLFHLMTSIRSPISQSSAMHIFSSSALS